MKKRIGALSALVMAAVCAYSASASAQQFQVVAAIGDSISTAMDADDGNCDKFGSGFFGLATCAGRLKEDWGSSWTTGDGGQASVRRQLLLPSTSVVTKQKNGARWDDALNQANALITDVGARRAFVTIQLGGNDVCRKLGDTLPTKAQIAAQIDSALWQLATRLPSGSVVMVATMPNIEQLRNTMRYQSNFVIPSGGTCQQAWNMGTASTSGVWNDLANWMVSQFGTQFPCAVVLSDASNDTLRADAYRLNREINDAIREKVAAYNAWSNANGDRVQFAVANSVYDFAFTTSDVSHLDCFHPSRTGQGRLASTTWRGVGVDHWPGTSTGKRVARYHYFHADNMISARYELTGTYRMHYWLQSNDPTDGCNDPANCYLWATGAANNHDITLSGSWVYPWRGYRIWALPFTDAEANNLPWAQQYVPPEFR
jgi:lysophospholipase L1-like esterase